jgi:alpha-D-ribose 1-methylphosphonate 5-triphosphate synthase subunit PhnG
MPMSGKNLNGDATKSPPDAGRRALMAVLANASAGAIEHGLGELGASVGFTDLRAAETGLVMLRGRIGGDGAPFNVGEATVTRAVVQLASGEKGFSYVLGRDRKKARLAALCDALWQTETHRNAVEQRVLAPLQRAQDDERTQARARTAATRVDFFTLVRGEDQP